MPPKKKTSPSSSKSSSKKRKRKKKKFSAYAFILAKLEDLHDVPSWFPTEEVLIRWDSGGVNGYEVWKGTDEFQVKRPESALPFPANLDGEGAVPIGLIEEILDGFAEVAPGLKFKYSLLVIERTQSYRVHINYTTETLHRITDFLKV